MLACIMLACSFAACDTPSTPPEEQTTDGATEGTTQGETEGTTEGETEGTTEGTTSTEEGTTEPPVPEINSVIADFNAVEADDLKSFLTGANQVNVSVETDEDGEQYAVLSTSVAGANDPCVNFNFKKFYKAAGMSAVKADDYKYVVLKVRNVNCSGGTFELFFYSGKTSAANGAMVTTSSFDLSESGWQYVLFDLSDFEGWTGNVNGFRFDYMTTALAQGETLHIAEIQFLESDEAYYQLFDIDWTQIGVNANDQAKAEAEQLLGSVTMPSTKFDTYTPEAAEHEDANLSYWFANMYNRTPQNNNTSTGKLKYQIQLAKNEIEGLQFILAAQNDVEGLKVYVSDFANESGDTLYTELFWGYYFNVEGERVIEALPPVSYDPNQAFVDWANGGNAAGAQIPVLQKYNGFDIKGGENQTFVVKATTELDTKPGEYTATLRVVDKDGKEVKKVTLFAYVWNFELPEATSCKTLMDLSAFNVYVSYYDYGGILTNAAGKNLPTTYYDYLLENRVCAYSLPFDNENGSFSANGIMDYVNNPRVVAFQPLGWSKELNASNVAKAYSVLSQNPEWLAKAYFYPVDEPLNVGRLDDIKNYGKLLSEHFPGYKLITPMHVNYSVPGGDFFSYVADYVNVWCPKTFFYNTFAEWYHDRDLTYGCSIITEQKLGTFRDRMWQEQQNGDELWWYVTRRPADPEITLTINTDAVNVRTLFWQQKLYNVDGFLYYLVNDWDNGMTKWYVPTADEFYFGMDALHEVNADQDVNCYSNGILLYSGAYFAQPEPVGCVRLECIRDGIEDYEYLTILEEKYGKDVVDAIINQWTTGVGAYNTDQEQFYALRAKLGALVEAAAQGN
ncbi:MAG: DUF4091 domain-containing protein [Clostridia bacterium]|nr:DUF4091 domain-containing protein [Clostridia bacterium]